MVQSWIANRKISKAGKVALYMILFLGNLHYQKQIFVSERPMTLFDHFQVDRQASFDDLKESRDSYLEALTQREDPEYLGNTTYQLRNFTMTREEVSDSFNVLTNHQLREMYDKHNMYFTEKDFKDKKRNTISSIEKYMAAAKTLLSMCPYFLVIKMALGSNSVVGRKLAVTGLLAFMYILFEIKRPSEDS